jgi:hypothetical protein
VGIRTAHPGFITFTVNPFLDPEAPNYLTRIGGAQPTSSGEVIRVEFDCNGTSWVSVPNGIIAALPPDGSVWPPTTSTSTVDIHTREVID